MRSATRRGMLRFRAPKTGRAAAISGFVRQNGHEPGSSVLSRARIAIAAVPVALACVLGFAACGNGATHGAVSGATTADAITLHGRVHRGPWQPTLSLKLVKTALTEFSVCAVRNERALESFDCQAHGRLPDGTTLRLEQSPVGRGLKRADSPGWGMLGSSEESVLEAALSNTVSGNRLGTVHYRVTLRDTSGKILARSNLFTVTWHR